MICGVAKTGVRSALHGQMRSRKRLRVKVWFNAWIGEINICGHLGGDMDEGEKRCARSLTCVSSVEHDGCEIKDPPVGRVMFWHMGERALLVFKIYFKHILKCQ